MATNNSSNSTNVNHALTVGTGSGYTSLSVGTTGQALVAATGANPAFGTLPIAGGGTNATSMATSTGIVKYDGTSLVTSSTAKIDSSNRYTNTSQPCFTASRTGSYSNVTGDGTSVAPVIFDSTYINIGTSYSTSTGIFTAPVAGNYLFSVFVLAGGYTASHTAGNLRFITTAKTYYAGDWSPATYRDASGYCGIGATVIAPMAANDTCSITFQISNGAKVVVVDNTGGTTYFSGYLVS